MKDDYINTTFHGLYALFTLNLVVSHREKKRNTLSFIISEILTVNAVKYFDIY